LKILVKILKKIPSSPTGIEDFKLTEFKIGFERNLPKFLERIPSSPQLGIEGGAAIGSEPGQEENFSRNLSEGIPSSPTLSKIVF